jgi:hypothetical protein
MVDSPPTEAKNLPSSVAQIGIGELLIPVSA